jgi:hypothetical protein
MTVVLLSPALLAICFSLGLLFDPEDGDDMFLLYVG